jgi:hypothetical protein
MKPYGGVDLYVQIFLTSSLAGGEWSASRPGRFTPGERAPGTHLIGGWVDPRAGLDDVEKRKFLTLPGLRTPTTQLSSLQPVTIPTMLFRLSKVKIYGRRIANSSSDRNVITNNKEIS